MASNPVPAPRRLRILVTGAAGLVGQALCGALAGRGHDAVALVHRSRALPGENGAAIPALAGNVTAEGFGLAPGAAGPIDLLVHCAAVTGFALHPATYDQVNVGGTAHALAVAADAGCPLLHVSTAYVCGKADGAVAEAPVGADTRFNNGYEESKAAAEALVLAAHGRGQPVAIARPSIVAGAWRDGAIGAFGTMYQLIRMVAEGNAAALPAAPAASLDLVPIDHVAEGLADIAERMDAAAGRIVHLASGAPVPLAALADVAADFPHLRGPRFVLPAAFDAARLSPRQQRLYAQIAAPFAPYLRRSPVFGTANLQALSGRICPPTDRDYLRRMLRFTIEAGFLPAAGAA